MSTSMQEDRHDSESWIELLESRMRGNVHVRFGGGPTEKGITYLPGGLPYSTIGLHPQ